MDLITDAFSKAIYSTWLFSKPLRTLFDCGEGLVSSLRNRCFGIERVLITHGHFDHIGGLPGLVRIRGQARGDKEKPLVIYYPEGDSGCQLMQAYIANLVPRPSFHLEWVPVSAGVKIDISEKGKGKFAEPFPVDHIRGRNCLGYSICEHRQHLKPEYASMTEAQIASIVRQKGRSEVTESYDQKILSYGGDGLAVDPQYVLGTELLVQEATFLDDGERGQEIHATVSEAIRAADLSGASQLLLVHFSTRYRSADIFEAVRKSKSESGIGISVSVVLGPKISSVEDRGQ